MWGECQSLAKLSRSIMICSQFEVDFGTPIELYEVFLQYLLRLVIATGTVVAGGSEHDRGSGQIEGLVLDYAEKGAL
jgi:hypothetical protein